MEEVCLDFLFVASAIHLALSLFHFMLRPPLPSFFSAQPEAIFGSPAVTLLGTGMAPRK